MGTREGVGEASVAVRMGRLLSIESSMIGSAEAVVAVEGNTGWTAQVRAAGLRGVKEPRHVRKSCSGTWEGFISPRGVAPGSHEKGVTRNS